MLVHYFWVDKRSPVAVDRLFDPVGTRRLPAFNWAGITALLVGILATWLFMYGVLPIMQGPIATAMGGIDLSWLAGGLVAAAVYGALGPMVHARYLPLPSAAAVPSAAAASSAAATSQPLAEDAVGNLVND